MDNFMSKLSQKINSQDTIKANFMADTAEKEQMKKKIQEYDEILQNMRNLYLKLESLCITESDKTEILAELKNLIGKSDEFTHRECVKVYRNIQAILDEQTEILKAQVESSKAVDPTEDLEYIKRVLHMTHKSTKANRAWLVLVALLSAANMACILLIHFGLL